MNKRISILSIIVYAAFAIVSIYILLVNVMLVRRRQYWMYYDFPVSVLIIAIAGITLGTLFYYIIRRIELSRARIIRGFRFKLFLAAAVLFLLQCIIVHHIFFYVDWDVTYLREASYQYVLGGMDEFYTNYFKVNPNNVCMLAITIAYMKMGAALSLDGYKCLVYTGVLLNALSVVFVSLTVRKLAFSDAKAAAGFVMAAIFFGFSPWLIVPYTDTYSIICPVLTMYIFVSIRDNRRLSATAGTICVVLIPAATYMIKPTNIFILLAIGIYEVALLLRAMIDRTPGKGELIYRIVLGAAVTIIVIVLMRFIVYSAISYSEDDSLRKPVEHYLLLGSNEGMVGMYSTPDDEYTNSFHTYDDKKRGDIALLKSRYSKMGIDGYLRHLSRKTYLNYACGIFGWGKEEYFVSELTPASSPMGCFLQDIYYVGGDDLLIDENAFPTGGRYFSIYASVCQLIWYMVLWMCVLKSAECIMGHITRRTDMDCTLVIAITLLGMFAFLSLFETNARYLYSMLPLYIVYIASLSENLTHTISGPHFC